MVEETTSKEISGFEVIISVALSITILTTTHYLFYSLTFLGYFAYHIILSLLFMMIIQKSKKKKLKNIKIKMETDKTEVIEIQSRKKTFKEQLATQKRIEITLNHMVN